MRLFLVSLPSLLFLGLYDVQELTLWLQSSYAGFVDPMRLQIKDANGVVRDQAKNDEVSIYVEMLWYIMHCMMSNLIH